MKTHILVIIALFFLTLKAQKSKDTLFFSINNITQYHLLSFQTYRIEPILNRLNLEKSKRNVRKQMVIFFL
jgi:hypothetical protein